MSEKKAGEVDLTVFANPLKEKPSSAPPRIKSIDLVKGFAMVFIIIAHTSGGWLDKDWIFLHGQVYAVLDVLGPSLFIFLSALSVIFSVESKKGKLPQSVIRNRILMRGLVIILVGLLYNSFIPEEDYGDKPLPFPLNLWSWSILVFLGFSQIFAYIAVRIPKIPRIIISLVVIFVSMPFRDWLLINKGDNTVIAVIHFILVSRYPHVTPFPWLGFCFLSSIFGQMLYKGMKEGTPVAYKKLFKDFMVYGAILTVFGILIGFQLINAGEPGTIGTPGVLDRREYPSLRLLLIANRNPWFDYPGMPLFLIRGTYANQFYNLGMALIILGVAFYLVDIKNHDNQLIRILNFFGQVSLSLFLFHYVGIVLLPYQLNIVFYPFVVLAYGALLGCGFYIWFRYGNFVGSPEWLIIKMGETGKRKKKSAASKPK